MIDETQMPIAAEHAFKEKSAKLLILLPLRTILKRTFQCETPCRLAEFVYFLWEVCLLFNFCSLQT